MIEKLFSNPHQGEDKMSRSVAKTISYRLLILILDFTSIYLFTGKIKIAIGFMVVSNVYTTGIYFLFERTLEKIKWGRIAYKNKIKKKIIEVKDKIQMW